MNFFRLQKFLPKGYAATDLGLYTCICMSVFKYISLVVRKPVFGEAVQSQKMARGLKFRI